MRSFDDDFSEYTIANYHGFDYGPCLYLEPEEDVGETVTLARLHPNATSFLATTGRIEGYRETMEWRTTYDIQVPDAREYIHRAADYGHHMVMVYGDHLEELKGLGEMLGLEVETVE